jgi:hypothetical protein
MRFISDISVWWLLPWLGVSIFLSFHLYKNEKWLTELTKYWQYTLKSLRAIGLFLIGVLLIGILFEAVDYRIEKPLFITLVDNSSSMKNYKDSSKVKSKIESFENQMKEKYGAKFDFVQYTVASQVTENGKINFSESNSDLSQGFEAIRTSFYNRNIGGIAFFSDGNFNKGSNPIYSAEKINLTPIFTVGIGDTIAKKDQYVKDVETNEIAFLRNKFPVEVDVEGIKVGKSIVVVSISSNGKHVASQSVNFSNGNYDYKHVSFLLDATKIGHQQYTVSISKAQNEYNYKNNSRSFYIEVLDARSKVLLLAGAPHPDVAALKNVIEKDENLEVVSKLTRDWDRDLKNVDLIIWHEPGIQFDASLQQRIEDSKIPILYCIGPNTSNSILQKLPIGMTINSNNQTDEVQAKLNSAFQLFEISTELQAALNYFPPLKIKFGDINLTQGNDVLLYQRIGSIQKNDPLLFFGKNQSVKYGVVYGEGIWKWRMNEFVRLGDQKNFSELIQKITQFLVVKQNTSALRITTPKIFTKGDEISIKAEFYNASLELITTPTIDFVLKNDKNKISKHQFGSVGNFYKLSLGKLNPGKYEWVSSCTHNGTKYSKSGVFIVEDLQIESLDSRADHTILNQISENSNGKFYPLDKTDQLIKDIENRNDIVEMSYKETSFNDLIDYKIVFLLLILIFGTEWFLRRWFGAY